MDKKPPLLVRVLPRRGLSRLTGWFAKRGVPGFLLRPMLRAYAGRYGAKLEESLVREVVEDALANVRQEVSEVGDVSLDPNPLPLVVLDKPVDLGPEDRRINVVLLEDGVLHVPRYECSVEVPDQGDDRLGVEGNRHGCEVRTLADR